MTLRTPHHPTRRRGFKAGLATILVTAAAATGLSVAPALAASAETTGIFSDTLKPDVSVDPDRGAVELGVAFSPQKDGEVTALQYYQGPQSGDVTRATLWTSDGDVIARANFAATDTVGWRTIELDKPVALDAGTYYAVSYFAPQGRYPVSEGDLTSSRSQNGFTLPTNAGVYRYGNGGGQPTRSFEGSNYLVDVVYEVDGSSAPAPTATPRPTASATATPRPTATPTATPTPRPTATATPTPTPTATAAPVAGTFPTRDSAGLPDGWQPKNQVSGAYWIREAGAVVEDLRVTNGTIYVAAPNVTLRRVQAVGANVINDPNGCQNGLVIEDSEFTPSGSTSDKDVSVIGPGGYTVRNVVIDGLAEGLRVGGNSHGCDGVNVEDSFIRVTAPTSCSDWHGDGIQGYDGGALTVRDTTIIMVERSNCGGTAPFFYPSGQGNTSLTVDGLLVSGGGYSFRNGMPANIKNLNIVNNAWGYGPLDVNCSAVKSWDAKAVTLNASGQPASTVRSLGCNGVGN